ncbi:hypothetical protein BS78_K057000 [Paspalum vaginatum]|uniref:Uncharacterized protein n=1 Tax=Paspalum vaginatum TaxID=158149 RepID=A0A9W7XFK1_9POAL|nr:hypothetical protein BS78_K057000 [Paspalum vaginatum]
MSGGTEGNSRNGEKSGRRGEEARGNESGPWKFTILAHGSGELESRN